MSAMSASGIVLRDALPADMDWVVRQHGGQYLLECGWNSEFEALVADIVAKMMALHDPAWERGWIAEIDGIRVGSVFVVRKTATQAQLRLLLVAPQARGLGLGAQLTDECLAFARSRAYKTLILWTHSNLTVARALYAKRGFRLVQSEPYRAFGHDLVSEIWELTL